jgi:hypothetical protein
MRGKNECRGCGSKNLKSINMLLNVTLRREKVLIIRGPGINNTANLVDYLETNKNIFARKFMTRIYLK